MNSKCACCAKYCAFIVAALGTFLIVAVLVRVMVDYTKPAAPTEDRAALRRKNLQEVREANAAVFNNPNYVWQDQARSVVRIPLKDAMEMSVKLLQDNKDAARSNLIARVEKATAPLPKAPSQFE